MTERTDNRFSAFRAATAIALATLVALLVWGMRHESSSPTVLGRYSAAYAGVLVLLVVSILLCLWGIWKQPPRLAAGLKIVYLLVGSFAVAIGIFEAGLRVANPWGMDFFHWLPYHMQGMLDDPELGYVHPRSVSYRLGANQVTLNAHGLRDKEIPYEKPAGERRLLLLGDSVTFGWGVSDGEPFADQMEPMLKARTGRNWEVINAGVNGYNTQQEAMYLRVEGIRYQPDVVLLTFVYNDVDPVVDPNVSTWRRYPTWPDSLPEGASRLTSLSYTFQAAHMFLRARELAAQRTGETQDTSGTAVTKHPRWPATKESLREIAELCASRNIKFLLAAYSIADPAFFAELESLGIESVSLGEASVGVPPARAYVSKVDPHPSAVLHQSIAQFLMDEMTRHRMLD